MASFVNFSFIITKIGILYIFPTNSLKASDVAKIKKSIIVGKNLNYKGFCNSIHL